MANFQEQVQEIKEKVSEKQLFIGRIPINTKKRFLELASEEFEKDYGMLLKKLVEVYDGFYPKGNEEMQVQINVLAEQISLIRHDIEILQRSIEDKKFIKTLSGKTLGGENGQIQ